MRIVLRAMQRATRFNIAQFHDDMADRGWQPGDLADRAHVARSTVTRFLNGTHQTPRTAKKLAEALGRSVRRYVIHHDEVSA